MLLRKPLKPSNAIQIPQSSMPVQYGETTTAGEIYHTSDIPLFCFKEQPILLQILTGTQLKKNKMRKPNKHINH